MTDGYPDSLSIRRGVPADLPELIPLIDRSFAEGGQAPFVISKDLPHLFTPARVSDYFIAELDGQMVATIGMYPYPLRMGSVVFQTAGIGQVATIPESRGRGVMSALLKAVCQEANRYDFTWLFGDRLRYGRYGWAIGGWVYRFTTARRYLPLPPPVDEIRRFDPRIHLSRLQAALARQPQAVLMPEDELCTSLNHALERSYYGALWGDSLVLGRDNGEVVLVGDGNPAELAALLAHLATGRQQIHIDCGPDPTPFLRTCLEHYEEVQVWPSASFRVGHLAAFFKKVAQLKPGPGDGPAGELNLVNSTTGEGVTLKVSHGVLKVEEGAGKNAIRLTHQQLSEVCFGLLPLDLLLPNLPADSPFRQVFPVKVFISELFAL